MTDEIKVRRRKLSDYRPDPSNANAGSERGQFMIESSIEKVGVGRSLVADANDIFVAGNKTSEALASAGIEDVIEIETDGHEIIVHKRRNFDLQDDDPNNPARLYAYYDNRASEVSMSWSAEQILADMQGGVDLDQFFRADELEELLASVRPSDPVADAEPQIDRAAELQAEWQTERGQVWTIPSLSVAGKAHRVMCGDSTNADDVARLMNGDKADLVYTDPPYGMELDTDFSGMESKLFKGKTGGNYHAPVIGDNEPFDPCAIFNSFGYCAEIFLWGADYYAERIPNKNAGSWIVWDKRLDESADKMWGSVFELCWSKQPHKRDIARIKWAGIFGMETQDTDSRVHPTQKPVELAVWFLGRWSKPDNLIIDIYLGSGTTIVACEQTGRIGYGMEISPAYVAVILQRLTDIGLTPTLA